MVFKFLGNEKEKEITKVSREIIIWQIHSNFALGGTPYFDTVVKVFLYLKV